MITDSKWIDYDLSKPPPGQETGKLDLDPFGQRMADAGIPFFESAYPQLMITKSERKERTQRLRDQLRATVTEIYSQGEVSSCVGFGAAQMLETTYRRVLGLAFRVSLAGMSVYGRIGSSSRSGAYIPDGMDAVLKGVLPTDDPENKEKYQHTMARIEWTPESRFPAGWLTTGKLFRGRSFVKASGVDMIMSALIYAKCGIVGRSGHCIPYVYPDLYKDEEVAGYANSWTKDWGDEGFGYDSTKTMNNLTCYVLMDVVTRPDLLIPEA